MLPYIITAGTAIATFLFVGGGLNYVDTGNVLKILPGHRRRFWVSAGGATIVATFLIGMNAFFTASS